MSRRGVPSPDDRLSATLRNLVQRVTVLERRPDGRAGASHELPVYLGVWRLRVNDDGDLVAVNTETGNATTIASA